MSKKVVVLGDSSSYGGRVTSASSTFEIDGKKAALLNDTFSCPEHGSNAIVECDMGYEEGGRDIVVHGCKTACGAKVFASTQAVDFNLWAGQCRRLHPVKDQPDGRPGFVCAFLPSPISVH